ncbi:PRC-barrel domain containing protein [Arthrobacter sp. Br18]|uniref:PRC-barrel domain containing protein n=1 Tax=Arthrobacter sp. Br18 TaxID=1312954 RepID=UPI00047AA38A|nr:PRC-barrel domain containing protein [Arthrobacter sp. Br18]
MEKLEVNELQEATAWDSEGMKLGEVNQVHLEKASGLPGWVTVSLGLLNTRKHYVPLAKARLEGADLHLGWTKEQIGDSPDAASDLELTGDEERALSEYYSL